MDLSQFEKNAHSSIIYEEHDSVVFLESGNICEVLSISNDEMVIKDLETNEEIICSKQDIEPSQLLEENDDEDDEDDDMDGDDKGKKKDKEKKETDDDDDMNEAEMKNWTVSFSKSAKLKKEKPVMVKARSTREAITKAGKKLGLNKMDSLSYSDSPNLVEDVLRDKGLTLKQLKEKCSCEDDDLNEEDEVKTEDVINDLGKTDWGKDNEAQMKAVQLLKGLALSKDPKSNEFMKKLSSASTSIAKGLVGGSED